MQNRSKDIRPVFIAYPSLYSLLMLNEIIYNSKIKLAGIVLSSAHIKVKGKVLSLLDSVLLLIKNCGLSYGLYLLFVSKCAYLITGIWKLIAFFKSKRLRIKTFHKVSQENNIPLFNTTNINSDDTIDFMKSVKSNMIVSGYNNQILQYKTCKKFTHHGINIHNSYLPDFGGLDAAFENLYRRVKEAGATIHYIDKGIDTGEIISQDKLDIYRNDTVFSLNIRQWVKGAQLLYDVLESFRKGSVAAKKNNPQKARYRYKSFPGKLRVKEFSKKGKHLISLTDIIFPSRFVYQLFNVR